MVNIPGVVFDMFFALIRSIEQANNDHPSGIWTPSFFRKKSEAEALPKKRYLLTTPRSIQSACQKKTEKQKMQATSLAPKKKQHQKNTNQAMNASLCSSRSLTLRKPTASCSERKPSHGRRRSFKKCGMYQQCSAVFAV